MKWNHTFEKGTGRQWTLGSRVLWVRLDGDEVLVHASGGDDPNPTVDVTELQETPPDTPLRFATRGGRVHLKPRAADRAVVVRPAMTLTILPRAEARIYVSTPAWMALSIDDDVFYEVPVYQPRPTWFGATPQAGEVGWASRTRARADLDLLEDEKGRITTRITLVNDQPTAWQVERFKVPCPYLPVFEGSRLWTPSITVRNGEEESDMEIEAAPPPEAGSCTHIAAPRESGVPRLFLRALGSMGLAP